VFKALKRLAAVFWPYPGNDRTIEDVQCVCRSFGLDFRVPVGGKHCIISHPMIEGLLTIPAQRHIKRVYLMLLVELIAKVEGP
jgi:hypothetical protein